MDKKTLIVVILAVAFTLFFFFFRTTPSVNQPTTQNANQAQSELPPPTETDQVTQ